MRSIPLIVCLVLLGCLSVAVAQEGDAYQLREPDAAEFLRALPALHDELLTEEGGGTDAASELADWMIRELGQRYDAYALRALPYDVYLAAEPFIELDTYATVEPYAERGWHTLVVDAWLRQTRPDLAAQADWAFGEYALHVQPVDFTGDGIADFLVHLAHAGYEEYFILTADAAVPEGYRRLGDMEFWLSTRCPYQIYCGGAGRVLQITDLTADGRPELIYTRGNCAYGRCTIDLNVWGMWGDEFRQLSSARDLSMQVVSGGGGIPSYPRDGDWLFENRDDDPALEIVQVEHVTDNRGCQFTTEHLYQWNAEEGLYQTAGPSVEYADSPWCALRRAYLAMQDLDFATAVQQYEHLLTFEPPSGLTAVWTYARLRLATAAALTGRLDEAAAQLAAVHADAIEDEQLRAMAEAAQAAFAARRTGVALCAALHDSLWGVHPQEIDSVLWYGYVESNDYFVSAIYGGGDFSPDNAGCDIYGLWEATLAAVDVNQPLTAQLEAAGWTSAAERTLDLDGDGVDEQVIWLEDIGQAVFRWFDGTAWHVAPAWIARPTAEWTLDTITIPRGGRMLVNTNYDSSVTYTDSVEPVFPGGIRIWLWREDELEYVTGRGICGPQTIAESFPTPGELRILTPCSDADPGSYAWDDASQTFTTGTAEDGDLAWRYANPFTCRGGLYSFCGIALEPAEALALLDTVLADPAQQTYVQRARALAYYRGVLLETLERPAEALAAYVALYEAAPDSAWGQLAALHFEAAQED